MAVRNDVTVIHLLPIILSSQECLLAIMKKADQAQIGPRSLRVTGPVPQRLKPGVENHSEWLASYAEVFALPKIDFDVILG